MLADTVLYLLIIGLFSLIKTQKRYDFLLSFFMSAFVFVVFYLFLMDEKTGFEITKTLILDDSHSSNIKIDIISTPQNYVMIFPFFVSTLISMLGNLVFKYENSKKYESSLFIFNLTAFIMLISSNNLIELIAIVFIIDILSQLLIKDANAGRRYSLYNFVADMGLFLVFAMVQSKLANLDVSNISNYYETGHHRDFIVFVIMMSLSIKFSFFLFQGYWLDLKSAKFHNLYFLPYLSTPMTALVLLTKLYPMLVVSPSFLPLLNTMVALTVVWGASGAILKYEIKEKFVYFNMLNLAFIAELTALNDFVWTRNFSYLLILFYLFNLCFYYLHYEIDREHGKNKLSIMMVLFGFLSVICAITTQIFALKTQKSAYFIYIFLSIFLFSFAVTAAQIWRKATQKIDFKQTDTTTVLMLLTSLFAFYLSSKNIEILWPVCFVLAFVIILFYLTPLSFISLRQGRIQEIQNIDVFHLFYQKIVLEPLHHAGLLFNIIIDFIFLERTFLPIIALLNNILIGFYRRIRRLGLRYQVICVILGAMLVFYLFER